MSYTIHRECWNERTYNGFTDSPYWFITIHNNIKIGLKDDGVYWSINHSERLMKEATIIKRLRMIIKECKLKIKLKIPNEIK